jgi:hypothetical protein
MPSAKPPAGNTATYKYPVPISAAKRAGVFEQIDVMRRTLRIEP